MPSQQASASANAVTIVVSSFLLGVAVTTAGVYWTKTTAGDGTSKLNNRDPRQSSSSTTSRSINVTHSIASSSSLTNNNNNNNTREAHTSDLLDSTDLDLRLIRKAEAVIRFRSGALTVVIERATNSWNHSAILRSAEALGIQNVWIVDPAACQDENLEAVDENNQRLEENMVRDKSNKLLRLSAEEVEIRRQHHLFARNATDWLTIREFETTGECITALRETGHQIYVTDLSQKAVELTPEALHHNARWPLPSKMAIVFGTEAVGCSDEMLQAADLRVYLPLRGFADSLNLSVAAALVIHHLMLLEPSYVASMTDNEQKELRKQWYPKLARQRLLAKRDKKRRKQLRSEVSKCETLKAQHDAGVFMTKGQLEKIAKLDTYRSEILELEQKGNFDMSDQIIKDMIDNPPEPLSDLRRADAHRITFAGKGIKRENSNNWKGLAGVTGVETETMSTAGFFRDRMAGLTTIAHEGGASGDHE